MLLQLAEEFIGTKRQNRIVAYIQNTNVYVNWLSAN